MLTFNRLNLQSPPGQIKYSSENISVFGYQLSYLYLFKYQDIQILARVDDQLPFNQDAMFPTNENLIELLFPLAQLISRLWRTIRLSGTTIIYGTPRKSLNLLQLNRPNFQMLLFSSTVKNHETSPCLQCSNLFVFQFHIMLKFPTFVSCLLETETKTTPDLTRWICTKT